MKKKNTPQKNSYWNDLTPDQRNEMARKIVEKVGGNKIQGTMRLMSYMSEVIDDNPDEYGILKWVDTSREVFLKRRTKEPLKEIAALARHFTKEQVNNVIPQIEKLQISKRNRELPRKKDLFRETVEMIGKAISSKGKEGESLSGAIIEQMGKIAKYNTEKGKSESFKLPLIIKKVDYENKKITVIEPGKTKEKSYTFKTIFNYTSKKITSQK